MLQPVLRRRIALPNRRQLLVDATIAAGVLTFVLATLATGAFADKGGNRSLDALGVVLALCVSLPLAGRRIVPIPVLAVVTAATALLYNLGYELGPPVGLIVALYSVAENRDERRSWASAVALGTGLVFLLAFHGLRNGIGIEFAGVGVLWAAAWFAGDRARLRRERMAELEDRARRAGLDAERERRLAIAEERTRIARELHDSAGHAVNVILVQAGAARLLHERDPGRSRAALTTIETVARETIAEIDRLVRVLRDDDDASAELGDIAPPAGLAALDTLADRHRAAGLDVTVDVRGVHKPLPSRVDRAAYRILQEAMTNAARHGDGGAVIGIEFLEASLEVTVTNPRRPGSGRRTGGHGLIGMRERAVLLGGSLDVRAANGHFTVRATLPYEEAEPGADTARPTSPRQCPRALREQQSLTVS